MDPQIWGRKIWYLLHIIMVKPSANQKIYKRFFSLIQHLLPCGTCRKHYSEHFSTIPFPEKQSQNASWLIKIHNRINKSIDKPQVKISLAKTYWKEQYTKCYGLHIKDIALYMLETYDDSSPSSIQHHEFFWKYLPKLLPPQCELIIEKEPRVNSKIEYKKWIHTL